MTYDVIVVGLGAMGSAATYHLAKRGVRVLGCDRLVPPHDLGSTHGETRIIREAYHEHPLYVPLVRRAFDLWAELERDWGEPVYRRTSGLMIGPPDGPLVTGSRASATRHDVPHELLDREAIMRRFPALTPEPGMVGLLEHRAGVLFPERAVEAHLELARRAGAELRLGEAVLSWSAEGNGVAVRWGAEQATARWLIIAAGAWLPWLVPALAERFWVERQLFHWFAPSAGPGWFEPARCPIALWEPNPGGIFATFPDFGRGVKVGIHHEGPRVDPDSVSRKTTPEEEARVRGLLHRFAPSAAGSLRQSAVCLYTNSPDHHFVIDHAPGLSQVVIASACSGHGFKFSSAIGEILADLVTGRTPEFDLAPFRLDRFTT